MKPAFNIFTRGLYALTPAELIGPSLIDAAEAVLAGGAVWLQYRAKPEADAETARALQQRCRQAGAAFIINDDVELATALDADGVHLGRDDMSLVEARSRLKPDQFIGVSCYNSLPRAAELVAQGADYLAFGSLYPSPTKPEAVHCPLDTLTRAKVFEKPLVAIGGIDLAHAPEVIEAGADLLAVISDVFSAPDITARARQWADCFC